MMAPTLKLKTPMEAEKKQQAFGFWLLVCGLLVCWLSEFGILGLLDCWFIGLLDCWIVACCLCVLLFALLDLEVLVNVGVDCSLDFFDIHV